MKKLFYITIIGASAYGVSVLLGLWSGTFKVQQLLYYTILSNIIIFIYYFYRLINTAIKNKKQTHYNLQGAFTLMIIITGLIYHILLAPRLSGENIFGTDELANHLVHTYTPLAVFFDWIFFTKIQMPKQLTPFRWLVIPFSYWIFAIIYASFKIPFQSTGRYYAYYFIDSNQLGEIKVFSNVIICTILFWFLGIVLKKIKSLQVKYKDLSTKH